LHIVIERHFLDHTYIFKYSVPMVCWK